MAVSDTEGERAEPDFFSEYLALLVDTLKGSREAEEARAKFLKRWRVEFIGQAEER